MVNSYTNKTYNTKSKYKDIESVTFSPVKKVNYNKISSVGDRLWWKWLGFIPLIPYKAKVDKYAINRSGYLNTTFGYPHGVTFDKIREMVEYHKDCYFIDGLCIFAKATVQIYYGGKRNKEYLHFETNEAAMRYIENLKAICKKVGNDIE